MNWPTLEHAGFEFLVGSLTVLGYILTLLLVPALLLAKKRWPSSTVAWLMAIITVPVVGGLLYLVFGIDRLSQRVRRRRAAQSSLKRALPNLMLAHAHPQTNISETERQLMRLAYNVGGTSPTVGNRIQLFDETPHAFGAIKEAIEAATQSIHLEYYIWQPDRIGTQLRDMLIEKARQGVKIRFLYDSVGSMRLSYAFLEPMRAAGIEVSAFAPGRTFRERWSINFRNHRKIIVVDGHVGFTGGMNIGDEYLGRNKHFGYWRDTHMQLEGPVVLQLQEVFATDWYLATGHDLADDSLFPTPHEPGRVAAQVVGGAPNCEPSVFHSLMFSAIATAQNRVTLATSYFVPTPGLCAALTTAALRGVRTRVLVSGPVTYWTTYYAARSFFDELLQAGVEVYEYRRGQQHAKTLTIDGNWSLVGTPNFDPRSVFLNFEVGVICYDHSLAEQLEFHFANDITHALKIEPDVWSRRSTWERLKENACQMFQPVL